VSLVRSAVRGALWTTTAGFLSRGVGLVATLIVTRFVTPGEYGEVTVAVVLTLTVSQLSTIGWGQYLVSRPDAPSSAAFHVTTLHVCLGAVALVTLVIAGRWLSFWLDAPQLMRYLPGLALSTLLDRVAFVPERILVRDLRFGRLSLVRMTGDLTHSAISITAAALGFGGAAIVAGNVARSAARLALFVRSVAMRAWLSPSRLDPKQIRELLAFGVPMSLGGLCEFASRRWDNLLVSRFFGPATTGMYNLAYNLADVPAIQIGEQIGDVLLPSFARMDVARRRAALLRSLSLLSVIIFPLAVGLGAIAPSLVSAIFDPRWQPIAPMLVLLSVLSLTRPIGWTVSAYLQSRQMPRHILVLEAFKLSVLGASILTVGREGPLWTCAAVGVGFGAHAFASLWVVRKIDEIPLRHTIGSVIPAAIASLMMALAVVALRHAVDVSPVSSLVLEVLGGAAVYVLAAFLFARGATRDLIARLQEAVRHAPPQKVEDATVNERNGIPVREPNR
jgi:PST family polysaccharide transporter